MTQLLQTTAIRLGVATETSAGPTVQRSAAAIWARWPRHPFDVAQDMLGQVAMLDEAATVVPVGSTALWRARTGKWNYIGRFEEAVAELAQHVLNRRDEARMAWHREPSARLTS